MPYGTIKVDTITFTDAGVDKSVAISGLVQNPTFTGNVTATGTISGLIVQAPTVTGTTANFASGVYTTQISGAIVKVPAGSAGAPSIQVGVGASVAPGLYGAGTDLLGISTGGAGRIFIDSTGRLGVGTSNPTELLEISATTDPKIHFIDVGNTTAKIGIVGSTALGFEMAGSERLRIDSAGRVGIGTSSPSTKLSVVGIVGGLAEAIRVNSTAGTQSGNSGLWLAGNQSTSHYNWLIASQYNVNAALEITPSTATDGSTFSIPTAVFTQTGRVGIGTSSPSQVLDVTGNGRFFVNAGAPTVSVNNGTIDHYIGTNATGGLVGTSNSYPVLFLTNNTERLRIDSSGNVGIGTASDGSRLLVYGTGAAVNTLNLVSPSDTNGAVLNFADSNQSSAIKTIPNGAGGTHSLGFFVASSIAERMRIDSSGNVGIGTSSPGARLQVQAPSASRQYTSSVLDFSNIHVDGSTAGPATSALTFSSGGGGGAAVAFSRGSSSDTSISFWTNLAGAANVATLRMSIDSSGRVGIGTSSQYSRLYVSGTQETDPVLVATMGPVVAINETNNADTPALRTVLSLVRAGKSVVSYGNHVNFNIGRYSQVGTAAQTQLTLRLAQGNTNDPDVDVLTLLSSGNVGIGTTNPQDSVVNIAPSSAAGAFNPLLTHLSGGFAGSHSLYLGAWTSTGTDRIYGCKIKTNYNYASSGATALSFEVTNAGGSLFEAARIDSSGRLLVGTSTAFGSGVNDSNYSLIQIRGNTAGGGSEGRLTLGNTTASASIVAGNDLGSIWFADGSGGDYARILAEADGAGGSSDYPGSLVFSTTADGASSPTERMRITSAGSIRTDSSPNVSLDIRNTNAASLSDFFVVGRYGGSVTTSLIIYTNGNVQNTNNSYGAISDIKLKENIVDAGSQWSDLKALQVRKYNFKEGQTHTQIGLVAQEVELISPGLVTESPDRDEEGNDLGTVTKSVNYSVLYMKAVKALQEAMERIETLEAKVAALEGN